MNYSIYKYPLHIRDKQKLTLREKSLILTVKNQNDTLCLWAYVPTGDALPLPLLMFEVYIFGTGNPCPPPEEMKDLVFLDTVLMQKVPLVWHVFVKPPEGF